MASSRSKGLQRRLDALTDTARRKIRDRDTLRDKAKAWAVIGPALAAAKVDPAQIGGLWIIRFRRRRAVAARRQPRLATGRRRLYRAGPADGTARELDRAGRRQHSPIRRQAAAPPGRLALRLVRLVARLSPG
jgi:hypothetical protein